MQPAPYLALEVLCEAIGVQRLSSIIWNCTDFARLWIYKVVTSVVELVEELLGAVDDEYERVRVFLAFEVWHSADTVFCVVGQRVYHINW